MVSLQLRFDMRRPPSAATAAPELYAAALEMSAWADRVGFDSVVLSEHHGVDDGFLPSPVVMGAAVAARTDRILLSIAALLVPLHDPLRLAEDIAVLDLISNGRVALVAGLGYRREEYDQFGVPWRDRGQRMDHCLQTLLRAWSGEPFEHEGRTVRVTPAPVQRPHPVLMVGGSSRAAADRAARLRLGFLPAVDDQDLLAHYHAACEAQGWTGWGLAPKGPGFLHVTEDPDRTWATIGDHLLHEARSYDSWQTPEVRSLVHETATTLDELRASDVYKVVTPQQCLQLAEDLGDGGVLVVHPLCGGIPPEVAWESLELIERRVLPHLRPGQESQATVRRGSG